MESFSKIQKKIYDLTQYLEVKKIERGFSFERKYLLKGGKGENYLLRITELNQNVNAEYKKAEFDTIKKISEFSSLVPKARFYGISDDESLCYMVLDYIPGKDAEEALKELSPDEQYSLGVDAGEELLKLHSLDAPSGLPEWHDRHSSKYAYKCALLDELKLKTGIIDMDKISRFILDNNCNMKCERQSFLHDDYHPGNLIVRDGRLCGIIDFNRYDWGDPVHDFVKTAYFSSAESIPFSVGQINGYNGGEVPPEFWEKYSLYTAMMIIPDIVWSHWYSKQTGSPEQTEMMWERVKRVYLDHNGFESDIPCWYKEYKS